MCESGRTDRVFEALTAPPRRRVLLALLEGSPRSDDGIDPLNPGPADPSRGAVDADRIALVHKHLPKLDDLGYVDWYQTTGEIHRGENWDEIAPILRLLQDYRGDVPEELARSEGPEGTEG